jgi:hypothetical protein
MNKIPYRIPSYHKMIWRAAMGATISYYREDIKNFVGNVVSALITGTVSAIISYLRQGTVIDWLNVIGSAVVGFLGWAVLLFLYNLNWKIPAILYRQRETEAFKFTWNDIEVKPFHFPQSFGNGIGLEVISDKNRNVFNNTSQEFSIQVTKLLIEEFGQGTEIQHPRRELNLLATDLVVFHPTTSIQNRRDTLNKENWIKHVVAPLAKWDNEKAWIDTKDGNKDLLLEKNVVYRAVVDFNEWSLEDVTSKWGCAVWCNLHYFEKEKGKMIVEMEIAKRNPRFEYE